MFEKKFDSRGLSSSQAVERLIKFGPNELISVQSFSSFKIFFNQFKSPLIYILVIAGLVTLFLNHLTDTIVIFAAVAFNTFLGFYQEQKSQKSISALKSLINPLAKVIRNGQTQTIEAKNLVPGDLVILTIGMRIPADGLLAEATDLTVNEAILTGESIPVRKKASYNLGINELASEKQENLVFMGTTVTTGIAKVLILKTGGATRLGRMGKLVTRIKEEKTPLQIQIGQIAKILALVVVTMATFIFFLGKSLGYETLQIFTTSVAVAVAAIPEGLAITLTVVLSLGMQRILKRKALVKQLLASETLGSVTTICADKTGTLTKGQMKVIKVLFGEEKEELVKATILCNDMRDPLEIAMMDWAKNKLRIEKLKRQYPRLDEIPFNPTDKFIATLHQEKKTGKKFLFFSGAPEVILKNSKISLKEKETLLKEFKDYGQQSYRLVGFAYKELNNSINKIKKENLKDFIWLGILIYEDPIRAGVKQALEKCQKAGIKVKIITGDPGMKRRK